MNESMQKTMVEVLKDTGLSEIPEKYDEKKIWMNAVGLVTKSDGSKSYCLLKRMTVDAYKISKTYGSCARVVEVNEIYPYTFADTSRLPKFGPNDKNSRIDFLVKEGGCEREPLEVLSVKQLNKEMIKLLIEKTAQ